MTREYYFIASLLPPLEIGHVPTLGSVELKDLLSINLAEEDLNYVKSFLRLIDFENMRALWAGEPFDPRGNVGEEEMQEAIANRAWPDGEEFPEYLQDFLIKFHSKEDRLKHYSFLIGQFFNYEVENAPEGFVRDFFAFQREMRLVMVGFRAKKSGKNVAEELQYEDSTDPIVAQILAQRDSKSYEPPFEYKELKPIFDEFGDSPIELHKQLIAYQFNHIVELWGGDLFTINRILNYMARLFLVEHWLELDIRKGMQVIDTIERQIL